MRTLLVAVFAAVVIWDVATAGFENSAVARAGAAAFVWSKQQIKETQLRASLEPDFSPPPSSVPEPVDPELCTGEAETKIAPADLSALILPKPKPQVFNFSAFPDLPKFKSSDDDAVDSVFAPPAIKRYIATASERTGVSESYLLYLAERESALDPMAAARKSSAAGLFQFIEATWLEVFHRHGAEHGLGDLAADIVRTNEATYEVASERTRRKILNLRHDPKLSAMLAAQFARDNAAYLKTHLGRDVSEDELYLAHFLGPAGAVKFERLYAENPDAPAAEAFPAAARANPGLFRNVKGRGASLAELKSALSAEQFAAAQERSVS